MRNTEDFPWPSGFTLNTRGPLSQLPTMMFSDLLRGVLGERGKVLTVTIQVSFSIGGSHFQVSFTVTRNVMLFTSCDSSIKHDMRQTL